MRAGAVSIRWLTAVCFEIKLPDGTVILTDPYITPNKIYHNGPVDNEGFKNFSLDDIKRVDYILLTHAHIDHDADIGNLVRKFKNCRVIVGERAAMNIIKFHDLSFDSVFPAYPFQTMVFDEFKLESFPAKHNQFRETYSETGDLTFDTFGIEGHKPCDMDGSLELVDYMITLPNGFRILMAAGRVADKNIFEVCKEKYPDLLIRQLTIRAEKTGDRLGLENADEFARILTSYHAKVVFPSHQESMMRKMGEGYVELVSRISQEIEKIDQSVQFISPEQFKWYSLGLAVWENE